MGVLAPNIFWVYRRNMMGSKSPPKRPGRPKRRGPSKYPDHVLLPLAPGVLKRLDAVVGPNETRLDLLRQAVERVLSERDK